MRINVFLTALIVLGAHGARILQSNDDGWAELYLRSFHDALIDAGHDAVLSAPAENMSGTGSSDAEPDPRTKVCQYNSCPAGSGPAGTNETNPRLNWVNSYPVTSLRYGLEAFGPQNWNGGAPELVVAGPNVGANLWLQVRFSGTVGIAVHAAHTARIPAIAFSGATGGNLAWNTVPVPRRSRLYAELATNFTSALLESGAPYLPEDVWLNVNIPKVEGRCTDASQFTWVLTRINSGFLADDDVEHCGTRRLPTETEVFRSGGCRISVSVGDATDKTTASADKQAVVLNKLGGMFTCLGRRKHILSGPTNTADALYWKDASFFLHQQPRTS